MSLFKTKEKISEEEIKSKVMELLTGVTDEKFTCRIASDDYCSHVCAVIERDEDGLEVLKEKLPTIIDNWRIVTIFVPNGYIKTFGWEYDG